MTHALASLFTAVFLSAAAIVVGQADEPDTAPQEIGTRKQLLVDDFVIARKTNVIRRNGSVEKVGPVLKPMLENDAGASFGFYHTALFNPERGKFQMWYSIGVGKESDGNPYRGIGYAESDDGIHWTQPLVSADGKSNVVLPMTGHSVTLDPALPWGHAEKFKAAWMHPSSQAALAYSSDGIRWDFYNGGEPVTHRAGDTQNQVFWEPESETYVLGTRTDLGPGGGAEEHRAWRFMVHEKGGDLKNHPTAWRTIADRITVDDPAAKPNERQFHHISIWLYEGIYFQLMNVWESPAQQEYDEDDDLTRHDRDISDYYLGVSRDVTTIDRSFVHSRQTFVPRGKAGEWDDDIVIPSPSVITRGDEHWIYYCGMNERIFNFTRRERSWIGLAKLPLDRFIGQEAGPKPGTILTRPFLLEGDRLELNVDARGGQVQIEVLDASGQPLAGFSGDDAETYQNVDKLRLSPRWSQPLSRLKGQEVRLEFRLQDATLYAFQIVQH